MLKKEQMVKGAILEVLPIIQDGLPGYSIEPELHVKDYLLIARNPVGFLRRLADCYRHSIGSRRRSQTSQPCQYRSRESVRSRLMCTGA